MRRVSIGPYRVTGTLPVAAGAMLMYIMTSVSVRPSIPAPIRVPLFILIDILPGLFFFAWGVHEFGDCTRYEVVGPPPELKIVRSLYRRCRVESYPLDGGEVRFVAQGITRAAVGFTYCYLLRIATPDDSADGQTVVRCDRDLALRLASMLSEAGCKVRFAAPPDG